MRLALLFLYLVCFLALFEAKAQQVINKVKINDLTLPLEASSSALTIDASKKVKAYSTVSQTELGYLDGVTSGIQGQLDTHTTNISSKANDVDVVKLTGDQSVAGTKTFTGKVVASSTTNGSQPCPVMTEAQRDAIASPANGDCIFNSTGKNFNIYDSTLPGWVSVSSAGVTTVSNGGTGQSSLTASNLIVGNGTSPVQFIAPGTSGNILLSNGSAWASAAQPIPGTTVRVPGASTPEVFQFHFGNSTGSSVACAASPCTVFQLIGNAVSSMTRSSTGTYVINTARTYASLMCFGIGTRVASEMQLRPTRCSSCSSLTIYSLIASTGALDDSYGQIFCMGAI